MATVDAYCQASGQRVNRLKSSVVLSPRTQAHERQVIHEILGFGDPSGSLMYLGVPILGRRLRAVECKFLVQRVRDRVEGWLVSSLSMMGRVTLIRSVLSSIPSYLMANTVVPVSCLRELERIFRGFLWGSLRDSHGTHLTSWEVVCSPLSEGGLGILSLLQRREALFARHAARFLLHPDCLWSRVMRARYGGWVRDSEIQVDRHASFLWKEICRLAPMVLPRVRWLIGNGASIDVSRDPWISCLPISRWPTFVRTGIDSQLRVRDLMDEGGRWRIPVITHLFGGPLVDRILQLPSSAYQSHDSLVWGSSCLPVAPIRDLPAPPSAGVSPRLDAAWIWKLRVHPRVKLFIWKIVWDRLPTCSLLHHRGSLMDNQCPICGLEEETTEHAILSCPRARLIWQSMNFCPWERSSDPWRVAFLECIRQGSYAGCGGARGQMVLYLAYMIWISRNRFVFASEVVPSPQVLRRAHLLAMEYARFDIPQHLHPGSWASPAASAATLRVVFISWESPPPGFVKINFDGSVKGAVGGAGFVIRDQGGRLLAAGGSGLTEVSVPFAELQAAWAGTLCAIRDLCADRIIIEGDSMTVVNWIRQGALLNPLLRDIICSTRSLSAVIVRHVYREANSAADWVASFVAHLSGPWLWRPGDFCPHGLKAVMFSDSLDLTRTRRV